MVIRLTQQVKGWLVILINDCFIGHLVVWLIDKLIVELLI